MRALRKPGERKIHWRDDDGSRHDAVIAEINRLPVGHGVVVRACRPGERDKRRRNQTLSTLCRELDGLSITHMTLESRGPADDRRDLDATTLPSRLPRGPGRHQVARSTVNEEPPREAETRGGSSLAWRLT